MVTIGRIASYTKQTVVLLISKFFKNEKTIFLLILLFSWILQVILTFFSPLLSDQFLTSEISKSIRNCSCIPDMDEFGMAYMVRPFIAPLFYAFFIPYYQLGNLFIKLVVTAVLWIFLKKNFGDRFALRACTVYSIIPLVFSLTASGAVDLLVGAWLLFSILSFRFPFLSGLFSAFAILSKYDSIVGVAGVWLGYFFSKRWKHLFIFSLVVILLTSPWFLRNYYVLGNPVYPYFNSAIGEGIDLQTGAHVPLSYYLAGFSLSFLGVPEGSIYNLVNFLGLPYWLAFLFAIMMSVPLVYTLWLGIVKLRKSHLPCKELLGCYLFFFLFRIIHPLGSDSLDLRYSVVLLFIFALGIASLKKRLFLLFFLALVFTTLFGVSARYYVSYSINVPYDNAIDFVNANLSEANFLVDSEPQVWEYGLMYYTDHPAFPNFKESFHSAMHVPWNVKNESEILSRKPLYLWTGMTNRSCNATIFSNERIKICRID